MALTYDKILIANDIRGKQGEAGFAPRINATTGTWERWDGTAWTDTGIKAQGDPADITGQSLYEYAVINGFAGSYDDWLKEYLGRHTDLPWCSGYFQDRSIAAGNNVIVTPIVTDGSSSLVSGNQLTPNSDGLYIITCSGGMLSTSTSQAVIGVVKNTEDINNASLYSKRLGTSISTSANQLPTITLSLPLLIGDYIVISIYTANAISTFNASGTSTRFMFAQLR